jgi:hypothetical protein
MAVLVSSSRTVLSGCISGDDERGMRVGAVRELGFSSVYLRLPSFRIADTGVMGYVWCSLLNYEIQNYGLCRYHYCLHSANLALRLGGKSLCTLLRGHLTG